MWGEIERLRDLGVLDGHREARVEEGVEGVEGEEEDARRHLLGLQKWDGKQLWGIGGLETICSRYCCGYNITEYAGSGFGAEMTYATSSVVHNLVSTTAVPINISQCISIYISLYVF